MKFKEILQMIWSLLPIAWLITLFSKIFIVFSVLHYLDSIGDLTIFIRVILTLWILMSFKSLLYDFYYNWRYRNVFNSEDNTPQEVKPSNSVTKAKIQKPTPDNGTKLEETNFAIKQDGENK